MVCLDFSKLSYETCKQYRTEPYPSFNANRTNITTLVTALNTTGQDRSPLNSTQLQRHSSLSTAAYAGIGLGTGAFILGLAALATFFYRRKNTWKSGQSGIHEMSASNLQELAAVNDRKEPQELHATEGNVSNHPVELDANFIYELEVSKR